MEVIDLNTLALPLYSMIESGVAKISDSTDAFCSAPPSLLLEAHRTVAGNQNSLTGHFHDGIEQQEYGGNRR
jgi:hypothetical protein